MMLFQEHSIHKLEDALAAASQGEIEKKKELNDMFNSFFHSASILNITGRNPSLHEQIATPGFFIQSP